MIDPEKPKLDKKDLASYYSRRTFLVIMVAHLAVFLFTTFMAYTSMPGFTLFSWHPFLMTIGFVLFMTEGILMFSQQSSFLRGDRKQQVRSHWIFQLIMVICNIGGFIAVYVNKDLKGKHHLTSWHGLIGLITAISCLVQAAAGIFLLYPNLIPKFITLAKAKIYHSTYGLLNYLLVVVVVNLGLWSNWANRNISTPFWYMCVACIDVLALVVMNQVTSNVLPRLRTSRR